MKLSRRSLFAALFVAPFVKKAEPPALEWLSEFPKDFVWDGGITTFTAISSSWIEDGEQFFLAS